MVAMEVNLSEKLKNPRFLKKCGFFELVILAIWQYL